ncbi:MAG: hypothetical protein H0X13_19890 [Ramlibacter sp.]|nr:hypothetical protein [Ramlibacter sp.]
MPSNNHPNRAWRSRMHETAAAWLARWPNRGEVGLLTREQLLSILRRSYIDGYEAGRASKTAPRSADAR